MDLTRYIKEHFTQAVSLLRSVQEKLIPNILLASEMMTHAFINDGKVLSCGNGGSAADAQHFSAELVGRFERERIGLPAIALTTDNCTLTAIANDYGYDLVFSKQISAIGKKNDVLFAISTSGNSPNIVQAINAAHEKKMKIVAMTGKDGGKVAEQLTAEDVLLNVAYTRTARIQEIHGLMIHIICDLIDKCLFGEKQDLSV